MKRSRWFLVGCLVALTPWGAAQAGTGSPAADVRTFVRQLHIHGIPFEEARAFDGTALPVLRDILADGRDQVYWVNAVMTVGIIGDARGTDLLLEFLAARHGELTPEVFRAVLSVPFALGHLARRGDGRAFRSLAGWVDLSKSTGFAWSHGRYRGAALDDLYGRVGVKGLGIAGSDAASAILASLERDARKPAGWDDDVREARELLDRVRAEGAEVVFSSREVNQ